MYQPNSFLQKAVESGDADRVRGALVGIIQSDPGFRTGELENALAYVKAHGINPFDTQDDPQLPMTNERTLSYFASAVTYLRANFTQNRLKHVQEVGRATHPAENPAPAPSYPPRPTTPPPTRVPTEVPPPKKAMGRRIAIAVLVLAVLAAVVLGLSKLVDKELQTPPPVETSLS